jgi:hypothetical protein
MFDAADGDVLGAQVTGPSALVFSDETAVVGSWPLDSGTGWTVDGLRAGQVLNHGAPVATVGPGEGPVLALDVTLPANGYAADVLQGLQIENAGDADPTSLDELRLWRDDGDGSFEPGTGDVDLGLLTFLSDRWSSAALIQPIDPGGMRLFVSITTSPALADSGTVRLQIPQDTGVTVESGNDGPIDSAVTNPEVLQLSTAALLATLTLEPFASTLADTVVARLMVKNQGDSTVTGITPSALAPSGDGVLTVLGAPTPGSFDLNPGEQLDFTWECRSDSAGSVRFTASASGTEQGTLLLRQSLDATSNEHEIFLQAQNLDLTPIESMPFSINRGQTDVVPLSLTLTNGGGAGASAVRFLWLRLRVEDELGTGIVPSELLSRLVVKEGSNEYLVKDGGEIETSGAVLDLLLDDPVVIDAAGQATLSLALDISASTTVPNFRLVIADGTWFDAEDATNGVTVSVDLDPGESYPVRSGLARIVAEATEFDVAADSVSAGSAIDVGQGQEDVPLLTLDVLNPGPVGLGADVRVTTFEISLADSAGTILADPGAVLDWIRVSTGVLPLLDRGIDLEAGDDTTMTLILSPLLSVPVDTPMQVTIAADLADTASIGSYRLRLGSSAAFDARDANTGAPVPVVYGADPVEGGLVTVKAPADSIEASGAPLLPAAVAVGEADVAALRVLLTHPGDPQASPLRCDSLGIQCRDGANPLVPATYVDRARVLVGDTEVGLLTNLPIAGGEFTIPIAGVSIDPGEQVELEIRFDVEVTAPPTLFSLTVPADGIHAEDENLGLPAEVRPASGSEFPLTSGVAQLESPARELAVGFAETMPPVLAGDGSTLTVARFAFRNAASPTSGDIRLDHLTLQTADADFAPFQPEEAVASVRARVDGELWAESGSLVDTGSPVVTLVAAEELTLEPGEPIEVEIEIELRDGAPATSLRLGCESVGVGVVQPASPLLSVTVVGEAGQSFPFWTSPGNFSPTSLSESFSNFPHPFAAGREQTTIAFYLPQEGRVSLHLWSARGERVLSVLEDAPYPAGQHQDQVWNGRNGRGDVVRNGVYLAEISVIFSDGRTERHLRKIAVVR